eukprot:scaffold65057_cov50-Prasinocladus_malaysianus.AAC.2
MSANWMRGVYVTIGVLPPFPESSVAVTCIKLYRSATASKNFHNKGDEVKDILSTAGLSPCPAGARPCQNGQTDGKQSAMAATSTLTSALADARGLIQADGDVACHAVNGLFESDDADTMRRALIYRQNLCLKRCSGSLHSTLIPC